MPLSQLQGSKSWCAVEARIFSSCKVNTFLPVFLFIFFLLTAPYEAGCTLTGEQSSCHNGITNCGVSNPLHCELFSFFPSTFCLPTMWPRPYCFHLYTEHGQELLNLLPLCSETLPGNPYFCLGSVIISRCKQTICAIAICVCFAVIKAPSPLFMTFAQAP